MPKYNESDFETNLKTICSLYNRIIETVFYDINTATSKETKAYKSRYSVPNEILGILENKAVCRGLSGVFRDSCNILGFDAISCNGFDEEKNEGHEWNQIRLGDDWYNLDLTWDRYNVLHKTVPVFLLTSDIDFYRDDYLTETVSTAKSHSSYLSPTNFNNRHKAEKSISRELIYKYLYEEEKKKKTWLGRLIAKVPKSIDINKGDEVR